MLSSTLKIFIFIFSLVISIITFVLDYIHLKRNTKIFKISKITLFISILLLLGIGIISIIVDELSEENKNKVFNQKLSNINSSVYSLNEQTFQKMSKKLIDLNKKLTEEANNSTILLEKLKMQNSIFYISLKNNINLSNRLINENLSTQNKLQKQFISVDSTQKQINKNILRNIYKLEPKNIGLSYRLTWNSLIEDSNLINYSNRVYSSYIENLPEYKIINNQIIYNDGNECNCSTKLILDKNKKIQLEQITIFSESYLFPKPHSIKEYKLYNTLFDSKKIKFYDYKNKNNRNKIERSFEVVYNSIKSNEVGKSTVFLVLFFNNGKLTEFNSFHTSNILKDLSNSGHFMSTLDLIGNKIEISRTNFDFLNTLSLDYGLISHLYIGLYNDFVQGIKIDGFHATNRDLLFEKIIDEDDFPHE